MWKLSYIQGQITKSHTYVDTQLHRAIPMLSQYACQFGCLLGFSVVAMGVCEFPGTTANSRSRIQEPWRFHASSVVVCVGVCVGIIDLDFSPEAWHCSHWFIPFPNDWLWSTKDITQTPHQNLSSAQLHPLTFSISSHFSRRAHQLEKLKSFAWNTDYTAPEVQ